MTRFRDSPYFLSILQEFTFFSPGFWDLLYFLPIFRDLRYLRSPIFLFFASDISGFFTYLGDISGLWASARRVSYRIGPVS